MHPNDTQQVTQPCIFVLGLCELYRSHVGGSLSFFAKLETTTHKNALEMCLVIVFDRVNPLYTKFNRVDQDSVAIYSLL